MKILKIKKKIQILKSLKQQKIQILKFSKFQNFENFQKFQYFEGDGDDEAADKTGEATKDRTLRRERVNQRPRDRTSITPFRHSDHLIHARHSERLKN